MDVDAALVNGLRRFCNLVSIFYAPYWLQCPLASEAAVNDLEFHRAMMNYSSVDEEVAEAVRHAFLRHRWYLTANLIPLAFCSPGAARSEGCKGCSLPSLSPTYFFLRSKIFLPILVFHTTIHNIFFEKNNFCTKNGNT